MQIHPASTAFCLVLTGIFAAASLPAAAQLTEATVTGIASTSERDHEFALLARDVDAMEREFGIVKRVVKLVTPSVVHIEASLLPKYRGMMQIEEAGSGVVVMLGSEFYVLTNRHVIRHSSEELVSIHLTDGRLLHPTRIWSDEKTDVAIMAIRAANVTPARLGNSDSLEIGEFVLAIGSPFGLSQSVTRGIVSGKGRHNLDLGAGGIDLQNFIQTDAAINPGNSGGPLVNLRGEVVGLNTAIASSSGGNEGIGFSIPINIASRVARQLVESNAVTRGYLGVKLDSRFDEKQAAALGMERLIGSRVTVVEPKSPAETAGMRVNDVIVEYNGVAIENFNHLIGLVQLSEIGQRVPLVIYRDSKRFRTAIEIGNIPPAAESARSARPAASN